MGRLTQLWQFTAWEAAQFLKVLVSLAWTFSWKKRNRKQGVVSAVLAAQPGRYSQTLRPSPGLVFLPHGPSLLSPPLPVLLRLWFYPSFMGPFKCHLDLGSVFIVPSSGHFESITGMLLFIVFHLIFYVSCTCFSPSQD